MRQYVVYILDLCVTLTFDPYVGDGSILSELYSRFLSYFAKNLPTLLPGIDQAD